jgi:hypothetical protein
MTTFCIAFYESYLSTTIQDGHVLPHLQRGARDLLAAGSVSQYIVKNVILSFISVSKRM